MHQIATRRRLNPFLKRAVQRSGYTNVALAAIANIAWPPDFCNLLAAEKVKATPRTIERLRRIASAVDFPLDEIFLS